jgi:hemerythrin-like domain-containing protein
MVSLNNEHRHIASLLDALAEQADRLLPGRTPDYAMMLDIARYMSEYPDEYHHPREDLLFARLTDRDPDSKPVIGELLEGHKEIMRRSRELLGELQRAARDGESVDNRRLKYLCDRYIGFYWEHINTEEGKVFPRATAKLRPDDWYAVNSKARYVDDPLFGSRVRKEYQRLGQYLGERVARATEDIAVAELFGVEALIEAVATLGGAIGEIRDILGRRLRASARDSFRGNEDDGAARRVAALPGAMFGSLREHSGAAAREIGAVVRRSRGELAEPFAARIGYLRRMLD